MSHADYVFPGGTEAVRAACRDHGDACRPGDVEALGPFRKLSTTLRQCSNRTDLPAADVHAIVDQAGRQVAILRVALAAAERLLSDARDGIGGSTTPVDPPPEPDPGAEFEVPGLDAPDPAFDRGPESVPPPKRKGR